MTIAATVREAADLDARAIEWLLASDEPGIRMQTRRDLLGEGDELDTEQILRGPKIRALLAGQLPDGGFSSHPYRKFDGGHWRLVSLVELGVPAGEPRALAALDTVLDWLASHQHRSSITRIDGRIRRCASMEGNALAVASRLGLAQDRRVGCSRSHSSSGNGPMAVGTATDVLKRRTPRSTRR